MSVLADGSAAAVKVTMTDLTAAPSTFQLLPKPEDMARLAIRLAACAEAGDVIGLSGVLGSGKTTFARAFVRARLGRAGQEVPSPTFTLVQVYECSGPAVWHFDLYRIDVPEDAHELGIEEAFIDGICLIEWPDRLGDLMPVDWLNVSFFLDGLSETRRVTLSCHGPRSKSLLDSLTPLL